MFEEFVSSPQSHHNYEEFDVFDLDDVDKSFEIIKQVKYHQSVPMRGKFLVALRFFAVGLFAVRTIHHKKIKLNLT